jgi:hypothetical protein
MLKRLVAREKEMQAHGHDFVRVHLALCITTSNRFDPKSCAGHLARKSKKKTLVQKLGISNCDIAIAKLQPNGLV